MLDAVVFEGHGSWSAANAGEAKRDEAWPSTNSFISVSGIVVPGAQLGSTIGFPTANMILDDDQGLETGVYAVWFEDGTGKRHPGVANFGRRPTVEPAGELILETFVLDFQGDLYGQECKVAFVAFIRPETKFASVEMMAERIAVDVDEARKRLAQAAIAMT